MKNTFLMILLLSASVLAEPLPQVGDVYQKLSYDLTGDGKPEQIGLAAYKINKEAEAYFGQLTVWSPSGKVLWRAPQAKSHTDAFAFGVFPFGISPLEWIGDLDGDSRIELLSPRPQSDVRPPTYRRYRWTGKGFEALAPKMLLESTPTSDIYSWTTPKQWDGVHPLAWVMKISGPSKQPTAQICSSKSGGLLWWGEARVEGAPTGLRVTRWTTPLAPER